VPVTTQPVSSGDGLAPADRQFTLGALGNAKAADRFQGQLEDVRIWRIERTTEEIQDNMFRRLSGEQSDDLIAYYTFNPLLETHLTDDRVVRASAERLPATALALSADGAELSLSTVPISDDAPQVRNALLQVETDRQVTIDGTPAVAEYADVQTDSAGRDIGVFKRCYATVAGGPWNLTTGFKVGDMDLEWVGQVQFDPQIMGYIEGAPPVPGENLTQEESYADASSVALTDASQTTYTYASSRDRGADQSVDAYIGVGWGMEVSGGLGVVTRLIDVEGHFHVKANFESSQGWTDEASSGEGRAITRVSTMGLRGRNVAPGGGDGAARFVPDNTGFALVQSETADVFAMRLRHTGALISYEMRPNPHIPKDWNIVTFPINRRYTKQGTLDGKVGIQPDPDFPNAGTYTPDSSYFKPIEAYHLKDRIAREEEQARTRFEEYRAGDQGRRQAGADLTTGDMLAELPKVEKRNLVNTYVWTADGGQFAEEVQSLDTRSEVAGGSYAFKGMGGFELQSSLKFPAGMQAGVTAMFGGHLNLTVTKSRDSESSFGLTVSVAPDSDLSGPGPSDARGREQGKVDAYRFMTFFLEPRSDHFDLFFNQVVDPIWLEQSEDPAAAALRSAAQPAKRPACWRVMHRVTFVSRVLPAIHETPASGLEHQMQKLDIASNYELVITLDPFVRDKASDYDAFVEAVDAAVAAHLPELRPHLPDIRRFLIGYHGVMGAPGVTAAADVSAQAATPPMVDAGADQTVRLGAPVTLSGTIVDEWADPSALSTRWVKLDGPGDVDFTDPRALSTGVSFTESGIYLLQFQAGGRGRPPAFASTVVTIDPAGRFTPASGAPSASEAPRESEKAPAG